MSTDTPLPALQGALTVTEAAAYLGIARETLYRWDSVPFAMVGKRRRYLLADLDAYLAAQRVTPVPRRYRRPA